MGGDVIGLVCHHSESGSQAKDFSSIEVFDVHTSICYTSSLCKMHRTTLTGKYHASHTCSMRLKLLPGVWVTPL